MTEWRAAGRTVENVSNLQVYCTSKQLRVCLKNTWSWGNEDRASRKRESDASLRDAACLAGLRGQGRQHHFANLLFCDGLMMMA